MQKLSRVTSIEKVFQSATPTLASIRRERGGDSAKAWLEAWIIMITDFVNVAKPMVPSQISMTADIILERYYALTVADIALVFRKALAGDFGILYNRLDGTVILEWFGRYFNERLEIAEHVSIQENQSFKDNRMALVQLAPLQSFLKNIVGDEPAKPREKDFREAIREAHRRYTRENATSESISQTNQS